MSIGYYNHRIRAAVRTAAVRTAAVRTTAARTTIARMPAAQTMHSRMAPAPRGTIYLIAGNRMNMHSYIVR